MTIRRSIDSLRRLRRKVSRWGIDEFLMLVAVLIIVLGTWGFAEIVDNVLEGETQRFDEWAVRAMRDPHDPTELRIPALEQVMVDISAMGGPTVLVLVTLAVLGFLLLQRSYGAMWLVLAATTGGSLMMYVLKELFSRPRPDIVPHKTEVLLASFPSGHSIMAAVVYLTLGTLLARIVRRKRLKFYFMLVAMLLTGLVGLSRVVLGVHYPTDVLAGWALGLVWAALCWFVAKWLQRRGAVEEEVDEREAREHGEQPGI